MATVNDLIFQVSIDSNKLKQSLSTSTQSITRFAATASKALAGIAAAGATGIGAMVLSTSKAAREIENLSRVANTNTTDFQRYAAAFKTVGFEVDKTADVFKDMSDRVGDFIQTGGGPLADFFENIAPKVGVTAQQFKNLSGPDALQLFVTSLEKANVSQNEFAFYMESIASDTTALIPLLRDGGAAVKELGDQAEAAGAVMSEIDLRQAGEIQRNINELTLSWTGFKNEISLTVIPAINDMIESLGGVKNILFEVKRGFVEVAQGAVQAAKFVVESFSLLDPQEVANRLGFDVGESFTASAFSSLSGLEGKLEEQLQGFRDQLIAEDLKINQREAAKVGPPAPVIEPTATISDALAPQAQRELDAIVEKFETPMERLRRKLGDAKDFLGKYGDQNEIYSRMVKAAHDEYNAATKNLIKSTDNLTNAMLSQGGNKTGNLNFDQSITSLRKAMLMGDEKQIAYYKAQAERKLSGAINGGTTDINTLELMRGTIDSLAQKAGMQTQAQEAQVSTNNLIKEAMSANTEAVKGLSQWLNSKPESIGSIDFNLTMDGGKISTTLQGTPSHLKWLKSVIAKNTNNDATAATN